MHFTPTRGGAAPARTHRDRAHYLYLAVIAAVVLGIITGLAAPHLATQLAPLGAAFINLIKMMISPIIFCVLVLGISSGAAATKLGRVGVLAIGYFLAMSTVALLVGLGVGNLLHPHGGLHIDPGAIAAAHQQTPSAHSGVAFLLTMVPTTLLSAFTEGQVLQTLLVALLAGFALHKLGPKGEPIRRGIEHIQRWVFHILSMILWAAPVGAFGAIAAVVGQTGWYALRDLAAIMLGVYLSCALFVVVVLGPVLWLGARVNLLALLRYLARECLLILSTSSSESALPRLIAKMEHLGVSKPVVGITVPTGYSFNLDGTAIYLTTATLFIADMQNHPLSLTEQISLLVYMTIASKGAAGVTGSGIAALASGLQSFRPQLVDGVGFILGIDRFMSEARALTNFVGNAVATVLIGSWTGQFDADQARRALSGESPFNEATLIDAQSPPELVPAAERATTPASA